MKNFLLSLFSVFAFAGLFGQNTPGSQVVTTTVCGNCTFINGNLTPLTNSGIAASPCGAVASSDAFYTFTAPAPTIAGDKIGIKVTLQSATFDGVIQIINSANENVACVNAVSGLGNEDLVHYLPTASTGQTFHVRIHSATGAIGAGTFQLCTKQIPELFLRPQFVITNSAGNPYQLYDIINREFFNNPGPVQKTGWLLIDQATQTQHYAEVNSALTTIVLNQIPGLCYNRQYMVFCRVQIGGIWCGYGEGKLIQMAEFPITSVVPVTGGVTQCGGTFDIYQSQLLATFIAPGQIFEWEFTTDNGQTVVTCQGAPGSSIILLDACGGLQYNKIYSIRIRAQVCGVWGPFISTNCFIFTTPVPYTQLRPDYCPSTVGAGSNIIATYVANATQYAFKVFPIACNDPFFTPTGPAQTIIHNSNIFPLSLMSITPGQCYGVEVKPYIGNQEGEFGQTCKITITGGGLPNPNGLAPEPDLKSMETGLHDTELFLLYPNPNNGTFDILLDTANGEEKVNFEVYDLSGKQILSEQRANGGRSVYSLQADVPTGLYLIRVQSGDYVHTERFAVTK